MKHNPYRFLWISGIFAILLIILYLVVVYKVKYEDNEQGNLNLLIYNCNDAQNNASLCATTNTSKITKDNIIATYQCLGNNCPKLTSIVDNTSKIIVLTTSNHTNILYDCLNQKIISKNYTNYYPLYNDTNQITNYIITTTDNQYGLLNNEGKLLTTPIYQAIGTLKDNQITNYNNTYIMSQKDNRQGVITLATGKDYITPQYDNLKIMGTAITINNDGLWYPVNNEGKYLLFKGYQYLYGYDDIYVVVKDNKLNIVDNNEKKLLIQSLDVTYDDQLEDTNYPSVITHKEENNIMISIKKDNTYTNYKYTVDTKKLYQLKDTPINNEEPS